MLATLLHPALVFSISKVGVACGQEYVTSKPTRSFI
jgi:hypothetical protein